MQRDGFIETVAGKGSYVAGENIEFVKEEQLRKAERYLQEAVDIAKSSGITYIELLDILSILYEED